MFRLPGLPPNVTEPVGVGVEITTELAQQLLAEGAPGLHFITMNRSPSTLRVWDNLGVTAAQ